MEDTYHNLGFTLAVDFIADAKRTASPGGDLKFSFLLRLQRPCNVRILRMLLDLGGRELYPCQTLVGSLEMEQASRHECEALNEDLKEAKMEHGLFHSHDCNSLPLSMFVQ